MRIIETLANLATLVVAGAVLYAVWPNAATSVARPAGAPLPQPALVGKQVPVLTVRGDDPAVPDTVVLTGSATVLYLFSTTCPYCEEQKSKIAEFLHHLGGGLRVLTASREPTDVLMGYWGDTDLATASLTEDSGRALSPGGIPALLVLGPDAVVKRALLGSMQAWTKERFLQEIIDALGLTSSPGTSLDTSGGFLIPQHDGGT